MRDINFKRCASESGTMAEKYFAAKILAKGWHGYTPDVDTGVDYLVETEKGGMKKVQITIGAKHSNNNRGYVVSKSLDKIRKDVDVVAIFIDAIDKQGNPDHHWFLVPIAAYKTRDFWYSYNTETSTFYINIDELKPPLDIAKGAWWIFDRKDLKRTVKVFCEKPKYSWEKVKD